MQASDPVRLAAAVVAIAVCAAAGLAISGGSEEATVDQLASSSGAAPAAPASGATGTGANRTGEPHGEEDSGRQSREPTEARADSVRRQYATSFDYVVPMESSMRRSASISEGEISVYVTIGILTLIAVALIVAGSIFCFKYSAALRASDRGSDPGSSGRQPILLRSRCPSGDDKLARHAQKSYYQRQKQNIAAAFHDRSCVSKSPIQEADSDQEDPNIYECPGLASTIELEVNNPMFKGSASDEE